jgi:hypothetical protein
MAREKTHCIHTHTVCVRSLAGARATAGTGQQAGNVIIVAMLSKEKQTGPEIRKYLLISRVTRLAADGVAE